MDWNNINRDRDTIGLGPIEYDQTKVPALIRKHANNVRTKTYGQEVREAQARNAELAGLIADEAKNTADTAHDLSTDTQNRFDDQIAGNTDINEVIDARRPDGATIAHTTLNERMEAQRYFINVMEFGAVGDGVTDDSQALYNAHVYANQESKKVIYPKANYLIRGVGNIPIRTNVDFNGSKLIIDQTNLTSIFDVETSYGWNDLDVEYFNSNHLSEFFTNTNYLPSLKNLVPENQLVNMVYSVEGEIPSTDSREIIDETSVHTQNGKLIGNMIRGVNNLVKIRYREIDTPTLISDFQLHLIGKNQLAENKIFNVMRDNVTIDGAIVSRDLVPESLRKVIFHSSYNYNFKLKDVDSYNPKQDIIPMDTTTNMFDGYIISLNHSVDTYFEHVNATTVHSDGQTENGTWGSTGNNNFKNLVVENSNISRIDAHDPCNTVTVRDSVVDRVQLCGSGKMFFDNVTFASSQDPHMITIASVYHTKLSSQWLGEIEVINSTYRPIFNGDGDLYLIYTSANNFRYKNYIPFNSLYVDNLTIDTSLIKAPDISVRAFNVNKFSSDRASYLPKKVEIKNIKYANSEPCFSSGLGVNTVGTGATNDLYLQKDTFFYFENIEFKEYFPNYTTLDLMSGFTIKGNHLLQFNFADCHNLAIATSVQGTNVRFDINSSKLFFLTTTRASVVSNAKVTVNTSYVYMKRMVSSDVAMSYSAKYIACKVNPYNSDGQLISLFSTINEGAKSFIGCYVEDESASLKSTDLATYMLRAYKLNYVGAGIMVRSDNGTLYRIGVDDSGTLKVSRPS